jgi:ribosomal protein L37AE/L43A
MVVRPATTVVPPMVALGSSRRPSSCPRCSARSIYREGVADSAVWCCFSCDWRQTDPATARLLATVTRSPLHRGQQL